MKNILIVAGVLLSVAAGAQTGLADSAYKKMNDARRMREVWADSMLKVSKLATGTTGDPVMVWDSVTKRMKRVPQGSLGGGASTFVALTDVTVATPKNGQVAVYDSITNKFKNVQTPIYNVADWGILPDSTDIRAKLIKLRDFVASKNGGTIFFPSGTQPYYLSDSILFTKSIHIMGVVASGPLHNFQGGGTSALNRLGPVQYSSNICVLNGKNGFVFDSAANGDKPMIEIDHLTFTSTVAPGLTATSTFLKFKGMLQSPIVQYCTFYGGYVGINKISAYYAKFNYNQFSAQRKVGLWMQNNVRTDTGDDFVFGNGFSSGTFNTAADTTTALRWSSGGGLKASGFKIDACEFDTLHGFQHGIWIENPIDPTSDILISHGSIENITQASIYMRGIAAPYVRNILVDGIQIAPVGSRGPAIDINLMEGVNVTNFDIRDWAGSDGSPAIKITNSDNVTIGDGIIRNYASNYSLTGSTNTNVLPKWDGYVHQGIAANNLVEADNFKWNGTNYVTPRAGYAAGFIFYNGSIYATTSTASTAAGATAALVQPLILEKDTVKVTNFKMAAGAGASKVLTSDANGLASWQAGGGGGGGQWTTTGTDIYYNTGNVGIGKTSAANKLDIQSASTGTDGVFVKNTNSGVGAVTAIRATNDANELGQFSIFSSTHGTFPNATAFQATKSLQLATDVGVASGGTSSFRVLVGGYSSTPSFEIKGTGVPFYYGMKAGAGTPNILVKMPDSSIAQMPYPSGGGGSSQWTTTGSDIYYNTGSVAIGKTSASNKLDVEFSNAATDGVFIKNTNTGAGAIGALRITNNASELAQFSIFSSNHATLPNVTAVQATKGLQFGTDVGTSTGGTSTFNVTTGGYSDVPSFKITGAHVPSFTNNAATVHELHMYNTDASDFSGSGLHLWSNLGSTGAHGTLIHHYSSNTTSGLANATLFRNYDAGPIVFYGASAELARFTAAGNFIIPGIASGVTAPTTSGTKHMVTVDANGLFSHETIPSGGGSGVTTVGTFSGTSTANGADIASTTITMHQADATNPGMMKLYTSTGSSTDGTMDRNSINTALALKAPLGSPTFTGVPAAPTATNNISTTQIATTAYVAREKYLVGTEQTALNTTQGFTPYTTENDGTAHKYNLSASALITAISAGTLTATVSYTDRNSTARTLTFYNMGSTTAALSATGASSFPVAGEIWAAPNTTITMVFTFAGTSITYDCAYSLYKIR